MGDFVFIKFKKNFNFVKYKIKLVKLSDVTKWILRNRTQRTNIKFHKIRQKFNSNEMSISLKTFLNNFKPLTHCVRVASVSVLLALIVLTYFVRNFFQNDRFFSLLIRFRAIKTWNCWSGRALRNGPGVRL